MRLASPAVIFTSLAVAVGAAGLGIALLESNPAPAPPRPAVVAPASASSAQLKYAPMAIGAPVTPGARPLVTGVHIVDLDQDDLLDVLYCEAANNSVRWIRQAPRGVFTERIIAENILGPARVASADLYGTGRRDVLVASMGQVTPNNDRIGAVVVLENTDNHHFKPHVLLERVARVTDIRAANLTGHTDGRLDLVVGQFGYAQGEVRWMRNKGGWQFESEIVSSLSGCVHTPVADFDADGFPDFAALISQEWEEVHLFRNQGSGRFVDSLTWGSTNEDYGSSGLEAADVDRDGLPDLIYTNGDGFDYGGYVRRAWHGVQWLENEGGGRFKFHRIGDMPGAYAPCADDLDSDGDTDLVTVSGFADWNEPDAISMMAWLNNGRQQFTPVILAQRPTHLVTAAVGDLDGNGIPVIVTGGFHSYPPFDHVSSVTLWRKQ